MYALKGRDAGDRHDRYVGALVKKNYTLSKYFMNRRSGFNKRIRKEDTASEAPAGQFARSRQLK